MQRQTLKGTYGLHPFGTDEGVDIHTALHSYTAWDSRQMFLENKMGTIVVGKKADLAAWDRNPYTVSTAEIKDMKCVMTIIDGHIVYSNPDFSKTLTSSAVELPPD